MNQYKYEDYITPPNLNWGEIFNDLERNKVTLSQISDLIGIAKSSIQSLRARETEPKYSIGVSILEIHSRYCSS